jgi:hypothetical protein
MSAVVPKSEDIADASAETGDLENVRTEHNV